MLEYGTTVLDPYVRQDVDRLEWVQCHAAHVTKREYRSREMGCIGCMLLELKQPPLQERWRKQWLTTLHKIVEGHIPAMPPGNSLTPADRTRRKIHPTIFSFKCCNSDNTIARHGIRNTRGFKIPGSKTEQYKIKSLILSKNCY